MSANLVCIAAVLMGVDATWQPLPEGDGVQYWIQIEPQLLDTLRSGQPIESYIPPGAGEVRAFRITVGTQTLPPKVDAPPRAEVPNPAAAIGEPSGDVSSRPPLLPGEIPTDRSAEPILGEHTVHLQPVDTPVKPRSSPAAEPSRQPTAVEPARPWGWLTLATLGFFASFGLNIFLGWTASDFRRRYRALVGRMGDH